MFGVGVEMSNSSLRGASQLFTFRVMEAGRGGGVKKGNSFGRGGQKGKLVRVGVNIF